MLSIYLYTSVLPVDAAIMIDRFAGAAIIGNCLRTVDFLL